MKRMLKGNRGLTLLELLVALVFSSLIIAALYRTFVGQNYTYSVQEQVVDMRQNARGVISNMTRELMMAGFGEVGTVLPVSFTDPQGNKTTYSNIVNANRPATGWVTVVTAVDSTAKSAALTAAVSSTNRILVDRIADEDKTVFFDLANRKYISIGGIESCVITNIIKKDDKPTYELTLDRKTLYNHSPGTTRVYPIRVVSYQTAGRNENLGGGTQPLGSEEVIENVQFQYLDANGDPTTNDANIRMIKVTVTAKNAVKDPQYKGGDGYYRREIASNIMIRNTVETLLTVLGE